ncbi:hypothetical protein ANN_06147 [Periplaneta americana]|uniref:Uncharacterized protein n=1 Tax=Periplaneta americana TaxID=6978 RepID=A0ABQ8TCT0_PERAM|nr:hypothetical protein ANN_06147 [Periplaneta americana]
MAGLCEGGNEPSGSLKASLFGQLARLQPTNKRKNSRILNEVLVARKETSFATVVAVTIIIHLMQKRYGRLG